MLDHRHFGKFVGDQQGMRKDRGILSVQPMENLNRQFNLNAARHVNKGAGIDECLMQRGELCRPERRWLRHEMLSKQIFVLEQSPLERHQKHAVFEERFRNRIASDQLIVRKDEPPSDRIEPD